LTHFPRKNSIPGGRLWRTAPAGAFGALPRRAAGAFGALPRRVPSAFGAYTHRPGPSGGQERWWRGLEPGASRVCFHTSLNFVVKMLLQPPEMKFNKEKMRLKKGGGVEITWCKFQELKMYFKLCIWCVCILHSCAVKTGLRTAILLRSVLSGGAHDILVSWLNK